MKELPTDKSISIVLTGSGGAGVMTAGQTLLEAATSCGLYGLMTRSTGPQVQHVDAWLEKDDPDDPNWAEDLDPPIMLE